MLALTCNFAQMPHPVVLCLGAHSDDIEIGCGGTILQWTEQYPALQFYWVVFSADVERTQEGMASANAFLQQAAQKRVIVKNFRDGFFPYEGAALKAWFEQCKQEISPDIIFTHYRDDRHQDHRVISELTWNTFRNHLILEYEIPKYDGDLGAPNCFVPLTAAIWTKKLEYLLKFFQTQTNKHWFSTDTFQALMRLRGMESRANDFYAEAFYVRKLIIG